jgi:hypothetical protein
MGQKLPPREAELYKRCDEILHYLWDPIGVAGAPGARDEYDSYLPQVFARVRDNTDAGALVEYLTQIEERSMGLPANPERAQATVARLLEWREWIWEHAA